MADNDYQSDHLVTLDRDLSRFSTLERAAAYSTRPIVGPVISLIFIILAGLIAALSLGQTSGTFIIVIAAIFGAYMALNIGANDVANNMGPAVGANALTMGGAIIIAAICESAGALLAGADVVSTIATGIISPESLTDPNIFVWAMMSALLASALWVNLATWIGAPVSTTHAVVGGVVGAGIGAAGFAAVYWENMIAIAASWVISPVLGGVLAAAFLWFIKARIIYQPDKIQAARKWVPGLVGFMAGAFATYLSLKGFKNVFHITMGGAVTIGLIIGVICWLWMIPVIKRQSEGLENRNKSLKILFSVPLVASAAMLSFAHGANDVANAVGPLAAIAKVAQSNQITNDVQIPLWVMLIGAFGISVGLFLFGPKLIKMVGSQITKLNPMRAYCVALSAAVTVILASWLGLPVSSTHIAVGAIFGVGFFREWDAERRLRKSKKEYEDANLTPDVRSMRKLVRRSHLLTIGTAWVVTLPASALISMGIFLSIMAFVS